MLATEEPIPGVRLVGTVQRKAAEKKRWGQGEKGKKPSCLPIPFFRFFPLRFILRHSPLSEHLKQASTRSNAAIHKETLFYSATERTQRAVKIPEAV